MAATEIELDQLSDGQTSSSNGTPNGKHSHPVARTIEVGNQRNFSYRSQLKALTLKSLTLQKRSTATNICQVISPLVMMLGLLLLQVYVDSLVSRDSTSTRHPKVLPMFFLVPDNYPPRLPLQLLYSRGSGFSEAEAAGLLANVFGSGPNNTLPVKTVHYDDSPDFTRSFTFNASFEFREYSSKYAIDNKLYDAFYDPPRYPAAFRFRELDTTNQKFAFDLWVNSSLTGDSIDDAPASLAMIGSAISRLLGAEPLLNQTGQKGFPERTKELTFDLTAIAGPFFYTIILHQLFPVFLATIVYEKEQRLREAMKMMGLKMSAYWFINYVFFYALYVVLLIFLVLAGNLFRFRFFTINDFGVYFVLFLLWGHVLIALAFFFSVFFGKSRTASIVGYFGIIGVAFLSFYLVDNLVRDTATPKATVEGLSVVPSFDLYRGLVYLAIEVASDGPGFRWDNLSQPDLDMGAVYGFLIWEWAVLMIAAFYLDQVFPSGYGIKRPLLFPFQRSYWCGVKKGSHANATKATSFLDTADEPEDVRAERERVYSSNSLVRLVHVHKRYHGDGEDVIAVRSLTLGIEAGECFGILGHNGAGKTTTISMLCGLFPPTSGLLEIDGLDLSTQVDEAHMLMGVCPQHDVLWERLSGREHLLFYGRLKNLKGRELDEAVEETLRSVNLWEARDKLSKAYSGGMKRRLSVAIALIGRPKVLFLDEPSTGLDPKSRSQLWQVILAAKRHSCIILTTHSMQEADYLCDRLAVMAHGELRCIGTSLNLKRRFGSGYKFAVSVADPTRLDAVDEWVRQFLPAAVLVRSLALTKEYHLPNEGVSLPRVFAYMEEHKEALGVTDWGIANTTLEDVFVNITNEHKEHK